MSSGAIVYDWTQPEEKIIVDMIRADNYDRPLTPAMLSFGLPEPISPTPGMTHNTRVMLSATPVAPFTGSQLHRYHRVDIGNFVFTGTTDLNFILQNYTTVEELVTELSTRLGVYLTADKVVFDLPQVAGTYNLVISDTSLCYYGEITLEFSDIQFPLDDVIPDPDLIGFNT